MALATLDDRFVGSELVVDDSGEVNVSMIMFGRKAGESYMYKISPQVIQFDAHSDVWVANGDMLPLGDVVKALRFMSLVANMKRILFMFFRAQTVTTRLGVQPIV